MIAWREGLYLLLILALLVAWSGALAYTVKTGYKRAYDDGYHDGFDCAMRVVQNALEVT